MPPSKIPLKWGFKKIIKYMLLERLGKKDNGNKLLQVGEQIVEW